MKTLRAMLDASLEIIIGWARASAVAALLAWFSCLGAWIWTHDARFGGIAGLCFAYAALAGTFGFWWFGNPEWRRGSPPAG